MVSKLAGGKTIGFKKMRLNLVTLQAGQYLTHSQSCKVQTAAFAYSEAMQQVYLNSICIFSFCYSKHFKV